MFILCFQFYAYRVLVGKKPLGRPRRKWEYNIKMDLRWDGVVWTELIWPVEGSCEHGNEPSGFIKYWRILE
jgi:hypothetical protein